MKPLPRKGPSAFRRGVNALVVGTSFVAFLGCSQIATEPSLPSESLPTEIHDPVKLIQSLAQRMDEFRSLRALAGVRYSGPNGRGGFQEAILVHRPDRLRLETLSAWGAILIVTVDATEIVGFHPREGLFLRGRTSRENLLRYTQVPLELHELTALFIGLPPVDVQGRWEGEGNSIFREIDGEGRDVVAFDPQGVVPVKWERSRNGEIELRATFSNFSSTAAGLFPAKISVEVPPQQRRVEIHYQEPELNVPIPTDLFVQKKPGHVRELPIESLGG